MANTTPRPGRDQGRKDVYGTSYSSEDTARLGIRRASTHATFFLPYLSSGMSLLDCGCGPGTVTVDLAEIVSPGEAVGIDVEESQLEAAHAYAAERGVSNVRFQLASVYELPFPDESFDAVFMHAVLEHLSGVPTALGEIRRVLKTGGVFGVRSGDLGASMLWPPNPSLGQLFELCEQVYTRHGQRLYFGRRQLAALREAGFSKIQVSASYDCWSETLEAKAAHAAFCKRLCLNGWMADQAVELGLADRTALEKMAAAWEAWGYDPDAFAAEARAEAVAWKE